MLARRVSEFVLSTVLSLLALAGCGKQGEGERCSLDAENSDCADGLVCKSLKELGGSSDICCPATGGSNDPACIPGGLGGTGGGGGAGGTGGSTATGGSGGTGGTGTGGSGATGGSGGMSGAGGTGGAGGN